MVFGVIFAIVVFFADVGSKDKTNGLQYRVVDEAVVVDIFIVDISATGWLPHTTLKFQFKPPVNI